MLWKEKRKVGISMENKTTLRSFLDTFVSDSDEIRLWNRVKNSDSTYMALLPDNRAVKVSDLKQKEKYAEVLLSNVEGLANIKCDTFTEAQNIIVDYDKQIPTDEEIALRQEMEKINNV